MARPVYIEGPFKMADLAINVLFLGEENAVRSIMAEALLNRLGSGRFRAFSAGTRPSADIHSHTLELLNANALPIVGAKPKDVREFLEPMAPQMDFVISVCDRAEIALHRWPGHPFMARWGITDPRSIKGDVVLEKIAFRRALRELENRIRLFTLLRHQPRQPAAVHATTA